MEKLKKLKTKYFSLSVAVRAAVWFTFCNLLQKGITMISMPIFTRLLTTEQYGEFTVYQSWYSIINIIVTFNLSGNLILNGMSKYENRRNEFISSIQTLSSCFSTIFLAFQHCLWLQCLPKCFLNRHIFFGRKGKDTNINIKGLLL